jgi:hypothetical protein
MDLNYQYFFHEMLDEAIHEKEKIFGVYNLHIYELFQFIGE